MLRALEQPCMMIILNATLVHGSTYIAGEELECILTLTNDGKSKHVNGGIETIAWASAQMHGQCTISEIAPISPKSYTVDIAAGSTEADSAQPTYFHPMRGERGSTFMMTPPQILFCNIKLAPHETIKYTYKETIPTDKVPTFRGAYVKYSYKLTVGTQRPDSAIAEIKLPFRVLTVEGLHHLTPKLDVDKDLAPSNPFQDQQKDQPPEMSIREIAVQKLAADSSRRKSCYNISNMQGKVAHITMSKIVYKIGEDISCSFDFSDAASQCLRFLVTLQSIEDLNDKYCSEGEKHNDTKSIAQHREFCLHMQKSNVSLPIPHHVTPTFKSEIVSLKWRLKIEFVTLLHSLPEQQEPLTDEEEVTWHGATDLETETIVWNLPVTLIATNPMECTMLQSLKEQETKHLE